MQHIAGAKLHICSPLDRFMAVLRCGLKGLDAESCTHRFSSFACQVEKHEMSIVTAVRHCYKLLGRCHNLKP